ncbi:MAG: 50S ribosomal protein L33 [Bdellovibrionota bacterium]
MAKIAKETIFLMSSADTGYFYTVRRNKKKNKGEQKLSLMKYDPVAGKRVLFEQKSKLVPTKKKFVRGE